MRMIIEVWKYPEEAYWNCKRRIDRAIKRLEETTILNRARKKLSSIDHITIGEIIKAEGSAEEMKKEFRGRFRKIAIRKQGERIWTTRTMRK